ncbi:hypothetical protein T07_15307 [Trichinella nelsoni]|uniref:Uncharacterized protein n=1 Tax=Trichinella nelsoni TaxID=6336 RepID=A0A0V0SIN3_9BILA|nr:hypothetical protein T07_15307 [Trichinella nelsoni]
MNGGDKRASTGKTSSLLLAEERCQLSSKDRLATAAKPCSTVEACSLVSSQRQAVEASQSVV